MAISSLTCKLTVTVAWWLKPYLYLLAGFCALTGVEPDLERVEAMVLRAATIKLVAK